jgi:hypothetical protein
MRLRVFLPGALATVAAVLHALPAMGSCPRNGGTVCNASGNQVAPVLTGVAERIQDFPSPVGMLHVWADDRDSASTGIDIYWNLVHPSCVDSSLEVGQALVAAPGDQVFPRAATTGSPGAGQHVFDDNYGVVVCWQDDRGEDADIYAVKLFVVSLAPSPWCSNPIPICSAAGDQTHPIVVPSLRGGVIIGWVDDRNGASDIYAQRTDSAGVFQWTPDGMPVCSEPGDQRSLQMVSDDAGGAYACWIDHRSGEAIYALRLAPDGTPAPGWSSGGNLVASATQVIGDLKLARDPNGFVVSWTDGAADPDGDVLALSVEGDGTIATGWPVSGSVVMGAGAQRVDAIAVGTDGSAFVVWEDETAGNGDLAATRIAQDGSVMSGWPAVVCNDPARQEHAVAGVYTNENSLVVIWSDGRSADGTSDLYGIALTSDGAVRDGWVANGTVISASPGIQDNPVLAGENIAWVDGRDIATNGWDLYGANFHMDGRVDAPPAPAAAILLLGEPRPNPSRGGLAFTLSIPVSGRGTVRVLDVSGRRVRTILSGTLPAGYRSLSWDGKSDSGRDAAPGAYTLEASVGGITTSRRFALLR